MTQQVIAITLLWMFLFSYIVLASIEFGAGFLLFWTRIRRLNPEIEMIIERYLSPFWEVTNVFLIAFVVGLVGFFPDSAYYYGTALLLPGSFALFLLVLKGTFFAYCHYARIKHPFYTFLQAITGLLFPVVMVAIIPISEGGFIVKNTDGRLELLLPNVITSPLLWTFALFAVLSVLFVSAVFLHFYADRAKASIAQSFFRKIVLNTGLPAMGAGAFVLIPLATHRPEHFWSLANEYGWLLALSGTFFVIAYMLMQKRLLPGTTFVLILAQYAAAISAYGYSHLPYILYPYINIYDSFVNPVMYHYLSVTLTVGLCMLIPGLIFLARLFLFNDEYVQGKGA